MKNFTNYPDSHLDQEVSKQKMWTLIFTELLLFGALFVVYSLYRLKNPVAFDMAGNELYTAIGAINTIILLGVSMCVAMAVTALQKNQKGLAVFLLEVTITLAVIFLFNKYFEWGVKFDSGIWPGSSYLAKNLSSGEASFYSLFFVSTGLHALNILIGLYFLVGLLGKIQKTPADQLQPALLENMGLFWHLITIIWVIMFPLFYLIH